MKRGACFKPFFIGAVAMNCGGDFQLFVAHQFSITVVKCPNKLVAMKLNKDVLFIVKVKWSCGTGRRYEYKAFNVAIVIRRPTSG